jgi:hypothetical protein
VLPEHGHTHGGRSATLHAWRRSIEVSRRSRLPSGRRRGFANDIGPELHRIGGFVLQKEEPGHLVFSDGIVDPVAFAGRDGLDYSLFRRALSHRIKVDFDPDGSGTKVAIRGGAGRGIREAIDRLGQPGHWTRHQGRSRLRRGPPGRSGWQHRQGAAARYLRGDQSKPAKALPPNSPSIRAD